MNRCDIEIFPDPPQNNNQIELISLDSEVVPDPYASVERKVECEQEILRSEWEDVEDENVIKFFPPAYIQRYVQVREVLSEKLEKYGESPRSVLEVGCAEFGMHFHLKALPNVQKIIYMDIDKQMLEDKLRYVQPLPCESLLPREKPLTVEIYAGCVTQTDCRILNSDPPLFAIVGIEILEHLNKDVEEKFVYTIFKKYSPPVVILTTPNSDFNTVLGLEKGKFRHWDHRFELTRAEFLDWCTMVCEICPEYTFSIEGIAKGPPGSEKYGCLSQMAVFERNEHHVHRISEKNPSVFRNNAYRVDRKPVQVATDLESSNTVGKKDSETISHEPYSLLATIDYPWKPKAPLRERVMNEIRYHICYFVHSGKRLEDHWENGGGSEIFVTISEFKDALKNRIEDDSALYSDLLESWLNEEGYLVVQENEQNGICISIPNHDDSFEECDLNDEYPDESFEYSTLSTEREDWDEESWD